MPGLEPSLNAMLMEGMIASSPSGYAIRQFFKAVRLTLDARLHQVVAANGTGVYDNVPRPKGYGGPLLYLEPFFFLWFEFLSIDLLRLIISDHRVIIHDKCGVQGVLPICNAGEMSQDLYRMQNYRFQ